MSIEFDDMIPPNEDTSRRDFLRHTGLGFGLIALAHILQYENLLAAPSAASYDLSPKLGHFAPRAKAVIQLFQMGGPSQMDLFDPKPELQRRDGQKHVEDVESFQPGSETNMLMGTPFKFAQHGQCGMDFFRDVASPGLRVRSSMHDSLDAHGKQQSPAGDPDDQYGKDLWWSADFGSVG